jgi:hypothetical protein
MSRPCATHYRVVGPDLSSAERHIPAVQALLVQLTTALSSPLSTRASQCHRPLGSQPNVSVGHTGTVRAGLHGPVRAGHWQNWPTWPWIHFLFFRIDSNLANFKKLYRFESESENFEINFIG